jgi:hypothetical protein
MSITTGSGGIGPPGPSKDFIPMSSSHVAPGGSGVTGKRRIKRSDLLAVLAAVSVVALIDSEIIAYGVPGIMAGSGILNLPEAVAYGGLAILGGFCLWLGVWLVGQVWKVEQAMNAPQVQGSATEAGC